MMGNRSTPVLQHAIDASERRKYEILLARDIRLMGLPEPAREFRFAAEVVGYGPGIRQRLADAGLKDWRFDFAWPRYRVAFEVDGLHSKTRGFGRSRHLDPGGYADDCQKINEAQLLGWTVYRIPGKWCKTGEAIQYVVRALRYHGRRQSAMALSPMGDGG